MLISGMQTSDKKILYIFKNIFKQKGDEVRVSEGKKWGILIDMKQFSALKMKMYGNQCRELSELQIFFFFFFGGGE